VGTGRLEPVVVSELIRGCADACRDNGLALLGGETAEMPGLYAEGDFDLVGFIVGAVAHDKILDGSRVRAGQRLIGLASDGLHTNGYSLARKILFERLGHELSDRPPALAGASVQEALLAPHRSYLSAVWPLLEAGCIAGIAHITGGGLLDNLPRILGGRRAVIDRENWPVPSLFSYLVEAGQVERDEAHQVFNMGVGLVLIVDPAQEQQVLKALRTSGEVAFELGSVDEEGTGVIWREDLG
jgi:phosphoribosylformylglycinamidine cyclo-ligase